jgi:hypothetical protein
MTNTRYISKHYYTPAMPQCDRSSVTLAIGSFSNISNEWLGNTKGSEGWDGY